MMLHAQNFDSFRDVEKFLETWSQDEHALLQHCNANGYDKRWISVCKQLSFTLGRSVFENWFKEIIPEVQTGGTLALKVKSPFIRDYILTSYEMPLKEAIHTAFSSTTRLSCNVKSPLPALPHHNHQGGHSMDDMRQYAQAFQTEMAALQDRMETFEVTGSSGGGLVHMTVSGKGSVLSVTIDPSLFSPEEKGVLEDLIVAAFADARNKVEQLTIEEMIKIRNITHFLN